MIEATGGSTTGAMAQLAFEMRIDVINRPIGIQQP